MNDFTVLDTRVSADLATQEAEQKILREERLARVEQLRKEREPVTEEIVEDSNQFEVSPFRPIEEIVADNRPGPKMILVQQSPPPPESPSRVSEVEVSSKVSMSTNSTVEMRPVVEEPKKRSLLPLRSNKTAPAEDTSPSRKQISSLPPLKQKSPVTEPAVPWIKPVLNAGERNGSATKENAWDEPSDTFRLAEVPNGLHRPKIPNGH